MMRYFTMIACCLLLGLVAGTPVTAQEGGMDPQAAMEAWTKAATPGEFHAFFAKKTGKWKVSSKMWMEPGAEPTVSESTAAAEMILGGRYLKEEMSGTSMGMPFEGLGITGYDNTTGVVTSVWFDTMGTATAILTGPYAKPGDPLELTGTMVDPMSGTEMKVRTVSTFYSHEKHKFEYYASMEGMPEMKMMEMEYTRVD